MPREHESCWRFNMRHMIIITAVAVTFGGCASSTKDTSQTTAADTPESSDCDAGLSRITYYPDGGFEQVGNSCPTQRTGAAEGTVDQTLLGASCNSQNDCSSSQNCCQLGSTVDVGLHCIAFADQGRVMTCPPGTLLGSATGGSGVVGLTCSQ